MTTVQHLENRIDKLIKRDPVGNAKIIRALQRELRALRPE